MTTNFYPNGVYDSSLPDPSSKRHAGANINNSNNENDQLHQWSYHSSSSNPTQNYPSSNTSHGSFAPPPPRYTSRDLTHESVQSNPQPGYAYVAGATTASTQNSPFQILTHPAFSDNFNNENQTQEMLRDRRGSNSFTEASNNNLSIHPNFAHLYQPKSSSHQPYSVGSDTPLLPSELLPPSTLPTKPNGQTSMNAPPTQNQSSSVLQSLHYYQNYTADSSQHYSNSGPSQIQASLPSMQQSSQLLSTSHHPAQFSNPARTNDYDNDLSSKSYGVIPRRHSIAVPNPSHNFGLWHPSNIHSRPQDWPSSTRSSFTSYDDGDSQFGADDGSDSDPEGGVMISIRPKDMPLGGPVIEGKYISLLVGPGEHQVKDFNILPINVLRINYDSKSNDYIVVNLICDTKMKRSNREIFMTAISAHHSIHDNKRAVLSNLKISQQMLRGRTKGFLFYLKYTLVVDGAERESLQSEPFYLWSNVSQRSFPRHERETYAQETQDINTKKRRRR